MFLILQILATFPVCISYLDEWLDIYGHRLFRGYTGRGCLWWRNPSCRCGVRHSWGYKPPYLCIVRSISIQLTVRDISSGLRPFSKSRYRQSFPCHPPLLFKLVSLGTRPVNNGRTLESTATDCLGAIRVLLYYFSPDFTLLQPNLITSWTKFMLFASLTPTTPTTLNPPSHRNRNETWTR